MKNKNRNNLSKIYVKSIAYKFRADYEHEHTFFLNFRHYILLQFLIETRIYTLFTAKLFFPDYVEFHFPNFNDNSLTLNKNHYKEVGIHPGIFTHLTFTTSKHV